MTWVQFFIWLIVFFIGGFIGFVFGALAAGINQEQLKTQNYMLRKQVEDYTDWINKGLGDNGESENEAE